MIKSITTLVVLNLENLVFTLLETHRASAVGVDLSVLEFLRVRLAAILGIPKSKSSKYEEFGKRLFGKMSRSSKVIFGGCKETKLENPKERDEVA